jgi:hypothetical protein
MNLQALSLLRLTREQNLLNIILIKKHLKLCGKPILNLLPRNSMIA